MIYQYFNVILGVIIKYMIIIINSDIPIFLMLGTVARRVPTASSLGVIIKYMIIKYYYVYV